MTDDPREILKAAGVECAEVETFESRLADWVEDLDCPPDKPMMDAHAAILALARLVAKYKWQRDELKRELALDLEDGRGLSMMSMASGAIGKELDRRWDHREDPDV